MATNKKITELTELTEANLSDDDVLAIVDVSAGTTNKVRKSTLASALAGVASLAATSPVAVDTPTGAVTVSLNTVPINKGGTGETTANAALAALGGISDPTSVRGDLIVRGASTLGKLGIGANNYVLKSDGTDPAWGQVAASEITGSVDLTSQVTGTLPLANGGTNATNAADARTSLGAAASGANTDITSLDAGLVISGSTASDALRITQTGAGNALVVEDSANPDSTPFIVEASGKVGIGTSSPQAKLDVTDNTAGEHGVFVYNSNASGYSALRMGGSDRGTNGDHLIYGSSYLGLRSKTGAYINFEPSGSEAMRIESDGGVKVVNAAYNPPTTDNDLSFDLSATNNFACTPSGTGTLTFTNHTAGQSGNILLDNSGGHAISLAATTKGDANLATTISTAGVYWLSYYDNGTNTYVVTSAAFA